MTADLVTRLGLILGDDYRVEREIGRGGMATVLLARDRKHDRPVAVKVLHPGLDAIGGQERFRREIAIAASLDHPNILTLIDSGHGDGLHYYIMPFVEGESLRQRLDREGQLSLAESLRIARAIGAALGHAHERGLVHRDVKPENILLSGDRVLVTDFGIARLAASNDNLTATGYSLGTPNYMSPEQATASRGVDARSDLYSLACVLYEMLGGHPPFQGSSWHEVVGRHAIDPVPSLRSARPSVSSALEHTIQTALAKSPADRYPTVAAFVAALPSDTEAMASATGAGLGRPPVGRTRRSRLRLVAAGLAVGLAGFLAWLGFQGRAGGETASGQVLLAVLPLENLGNPAYDYIADGLSEEIATRLAGVKGIGVIARNTSIRYRGTGKTVQEIGRELGVRYIVEGTLRWAEPSGADSRVVKVTPSLIDVSTGLSVWGQGYERSFSNVFDLQAGIAERVVAALEIRLGEAERLSLSSSATESEDAYREYALGRYLWKKRTPEGLVGAVAAFRRALALDSTYARAYAGLADAYVLFSQFGVTAIGGDEAFAEARRAATQALDLDPDLAEAHASLGEVLWYRDWDWAGAEAQFRRALELDPEYATAHQWYSELLTGMGRVAEGLREARLAVMFDPTSAIIVHAEAFALLASHQYTEAVAAFRRALERDPDLSYARVGLVWAYVSAGDSIGAFRALDETGDTTALSRAWARAAIDPARRPEAVRVAAATPDRLAGMPSTLQAIYLAGLGRDAGAIDVLVRAADQHDIAALGLKSLPFYDSLRKDPRFIALVARLGLPPDPVP